MINNYSVGLACDHDIVVWVEEGAEGVQEPLHVGHQIITEYGVAT
jgi:hypothetical protein